MLQLSHAKNKSQMFVSINVISTDLVETLWRDNQSKVTWRVLNANFNLDESCDSGENIKVSYVQYTNKCPELWEFFFNCMFPHQVKSEQLKHKTNTVFQSFHYMIQNGRTKTPFHISLYQVIHDTSRSKIFINRMNKLGLSISYDKIGRIGIVLAWKTTEAEAQ